MYLIPSSWTIAFKVKWAVQTLDIFIHLALYLSFSYIRDIKVKFSHLALFIEMSFLRNFSFLADIWVYVNGLRQLCFLNRPDFGKLSQIVGSDASKMSTNVLTSTPAWTSESTTFWNESKGMWRICSFFRHTILCVSLQQFSVRLVMCQQYFGSPP